MKMMWGAIRAVSVEMLGVLFVLWIMFVAAGWTLETAGLESPRTTARSWNWLATKPRTNSETNRWAVSDVTARSTPPANSERTAASHLDESWETLAAFAGWSIGGEQTGAAHGERQDFHQRPFRLQLGEFLARKWRQQEVPSAALKWPWLSGESSESAETNRRFHPRHESGSLRDGASRFNRLVLLGDRLFEPNSAQEDEAAEEFPGLLSTL